MRTTRLLVLLALLGGATLAVYALDGENGATVTTVFNETGLVNGTDYSDAWYSVTWGDLTYVYLGPEGWNLETPVIGTNASGDVFVRVAGYDASSTLYSGVVRYDGSGYKHLVQDVLVQSYSGQVGSRVDCLVVSPTTAGKLTAGDPVVSCFVQNADGGIEARLVSLGHGSSPVTETTVHSFSEARVFSFGIDGSGSIFAAVRNTSGVTALVKLTVSGSGYAATTLRTGIHEIGTVVGPDGSPYVFDSGALWGQTNGTNEILRVDPDTGASSTYASVSRKIFFGGWCWDGAGVFRIGIGDPKKLGGHVTEVKSGETVSLDDAIATTTHYADLRGFTGGSSNGEVYVLDWPGSADSTPVVVYKVEPGSGGGGGKPPKKPK
jgi:hypothetical protein